MINNLASNPQIQEALISGLLGMVGGFLQNSKHITNLAGINELNEESIIILDSLMKKGVTIDHLKKLDQMSNSKLQSLLIML
jgi:hypothetical protein